ncbi:helix-turn-helix domain-containing protein [Pedobacter sp.]|uniref:helix-turn-helix domain-containing protein n=1 Tax=Pedobacter sp. TaxID=1411316 RepID=UPI003C68878C
MKSKIELIKEKMRVLGMSNYELAKGASVSESTIGRVVSGRSNPNPQTLSKLCGHLGIADHNESLVTMTKDEFDALKKENDFLRDIIQSLIGNKSSEKGFKEKISITGNGDFAFINRANA